MNQANKDRNSYKRKFHSRLKIFKKNIIKTFLIEEKYDCLPNEKSRM